MADQNTAIELLEAIEIVIQLVRLEGRGHSVFPRSGFFIRAMRDVFANDLLDVDFFGRDEMGKSVLRIEFRQSSYPAVELRERRPLHGNDLVQPGQTCIETNGFVGEAHGFGLAWLANGDESEGFRIVVLFGFLRQSVQVWISSPVAKASLNGDDVVPLRKRDLEGLAEHGDQEEEERGKDAGCDDRKSGLAHGTFLVEEFAGGRNGAAMVAQEHDREDGVFRENARAAE